MPPLDLPVPEAGAILPATKFANEALNARAFGAISGPSDMQPKLQKAADAALASAGAVVLGAGAYQTSRVVVNGSCSLRGAGKGSELRQNSTGLAATAIAYMLPSDHPTVKLTDVPFTAGQRTFLTSNTQQLAIGSKVLMRVGEDTTDVNECFMRWYDVVTAVVPNVSFTVKVGAPRGCPAIAHSLPGSTFANSCVHIDRAAQNSTIEKFSATSGSQRAVGGFALSYAQNCSFRDLWLGDVDGGFLLDGCDTCTIDGIYIERADWSAYAAAGRAVSANGNTNCTVRNVGTLDVTGIAIYLESQNRQLTFDGCSLRSGPDASGNGRPVVFVGGQSEGIVLRNFFHCHAATRILLAEEITSTNSYRTENWYIDGADCHYFPIQNHYGDLRYQGVTWTQRLTKNIQAYLTPNTVHTIQLPRGLVAQVRVLATSGGGVSAAVLLDGQGSSVNLAPAFATPGTMQIVNGGIGAASDTNKNNSEAHTIQITTGSGLAADTRVFIEIDYLARAASNNPAYPNDQLLQVRQLYLDGAVHLRGSAAPTAGTWARGSVVWNSAPSAAGMIGWICTAAGTPGTWKTWGVISP